MTYREKALQIALTQLGVREQPLNSNTGPQVRKYQAASSLGGTGWSWCDAFVDWCFMEAGHPLVELDRSAGVPLTLDLARKRGWVVAVPQRGDLVCYDWNGDKTPDHIGIVLDGHVGTPWLTAIEGNTSSGAAGSQSNGDGVYKRDRSKSLVLAYIRVPGEMPTPKPRFVTRLVHRFFHNSRIPTQMTYEETKKV